VHGSAFIEKKATPRFEIVGELARLSVPVTLRSAVQGQILGTRVTCFDAVGAVLQAGPMTPGASSLKLTPGVMARLDQLELTARTS
jgi:hypothetical protein